MKTKILKYWVDVLAVIIFLIVGLLVETNFIHKENINEVTPITENIICDVEETIEYNESTWIKCNANKSIEMDYIRVTNNKSESKEIVVVPQGQSFEIAQTYSTIDPFDKVDTLDEVVITIDDDLSNYDIYVNLEAKDIENTNFDAIQFSAFNFRNVIFITMTLSIIFIMVRHFNFYKNNIAASFLLLSLLFGISAMFLNPSVHAFDEYAHFVKAYDDNPLAFINYKVPENFDLFIGLRHNNSWFELSNNIDLISKLPLTSEYYSTAELYIPITYFPYHIGLAIASLFTSSIHNIYLAGKLSGIIIHSLLGAYLIKHSKFFKRSIFMLLLFPNVIMIGISYSLDYILIISVLMLFATILNIRDSRNLTRKDFTILCLSACFIVLVKLPYFLITPIIFILYKYIDKKQFKKLATCYFGVVVLSLIITALYVSTKGAAQFGEIKEGISTIGQVNFVLNHPLVFIKATHPQFKLIISSFFDGLFQLHYVSGEVNDRFGMLNTNLIWPVIPFFIMMIFSDNQKVNFNIKERFLLLITVILSTFGVMGFLYLTFTPVGSQYLQGYQMRYFTPLIILMLSALLPQNKDREVNKEFGIVYAIKHLLVLIFLYREISLLGTYYSLYMYYAVLVLIILVLRNLKSWIVYSDKFMTVFIVMYYVMLLTQIYFLQYNI